MPRPRAAGHEPFGAPPPEVSHKYTWPNLRAPDSANRASRHPRSRPNRRGSRGVGTSRAARGAHAIPQAKRPQAPRVREPEVRRLTTTSDADSADHAKSADDGANSGPVPMLSLRSVQ